MCATRHKNNKRLQRNDIQRVRYIPTDFLVTNTIELVATEGNFGRRDTLPVVVVKV